MKKIIITIAILGALASCDNITEIDVNPKAAPIVQSQTLFANAQKNLTDWVTDCDVNTNIYRMLVQQWTETTYIDEANYDIHTRTIPDNQWHIIYRDVLRDLKEAYDVVGQNLDLKVPAGAQKNQKAMIEIVQVFAWSGLVQTWGSAPYTESLDPFAHPTPKYDDGAAIHAALITKLDGALAALDPAEGAFDDGADLFFNNDIVAWMRFANCLKLRLGMLIADSNPTAASLIVQQAIAGGLIISNDENAIFTYLSAPPNTNQVWVNLVQSQRHDFVLADTFVDWMNARNDPRRPSYMTFDNSGTAYTGGIYGSNNSYQTYSHVAEKIEAADFEAILFDYSEVEFFLAEAAERSLGGLVPADAESHYNKAITASMEYWKVAPLDITTYLARTDVAYTTAAGTWQQKIGEQSWVALYNRGFEAWTQYRRLDFPALVAPPEALSDVPQRLTYPISEQNLNTANYEQSLSDEGMASDIVTNKLFWDKF